MKCYGIYTALITPFNHTDSLDEEGLQLLIHRQISAQIDGLAVLGTTGEVFSLRGPERTTLTRLARAATALPLMVGCGTCSTSQTIDHIKKAADLGANSALVLTPFYHKPTQEGLVRHFERVSEKSPLPILLYTNPSRTGVYLKAETIHRLAEYDNIIGIKESSGDLSLFSELIAFIKPKRPDFSIIAGDDSLFFPAMALGGDGVISGTANLMPQTMKALLQLCVQKDWDRGRQLHLQLTPLFKALTLEPNPIPLKAALQHCGLPAGKPRLPLLPLKSELFPKIKETLQTLKSHGLSD